MHEKLIFTARNCPGSGMGSLSDMIAGTRFDLVAVPDNCLLEIFITDLSQPNTNPDGNARELPKRDRGVSVDEQETATTECDHDYDTSGGHRHVAFCSKDGCKSMIYL